MTVEEIKNWLLQQREESLKEGEAARVAMHRCEGAAAVCNRLLQMLEKPSTEEQPVGDSVDPAPGASPGE